MLQPDTGRDRSMEDFLGTLLRIGVTLAGLVVAIGACIYMARHATEPADYGHFEGTPPEYLDFWAIVTGVLNGRGRALIQMGLLILVATPVARVFFSLILFAKERDWRYVAITSVVFAMLLVSIFVPGAIHN
jgi:uncharacterized membrane protein